MLYEGMPVLQWQSSNLIVIRKLLSFMEMLLRVSLAWTLR